MSLDTDQPPLAPHQLENPPVKTPVWVPLVKWGALAAVVAVGLWVCLRLVELGHTLWVVVVAFVVMAVLAVYSTRRAVPMKYLLPGLLLLLGLQVLPIAMTVQTAFTNYGQGHVLSKEEAIQSLIANSVQEVPNTPRYVMSVAVPEGADKTTGALALLLVAPDGTMQVGTKDGLTALPAEGVEQSTTKKITKAPGWTILNAREVNARKDLQQLAVPTADGGGIKPVGLSEAFEGRATRSYDAASDTITDTVTTPPKVYVVKNAYFVPQDGQGEALATGWKENVGLKNFSTIFTNASIRAGFLKIFVWNVAFAALSVITTFILGMLLALLFNDPRLRGKGIYRSLLVLPYAIPGFVTSLLWMNMFNQDYGLVNKMTGLSIDWLGDPWAAKAAILITNLWLGFPYMFLITLGALQSIPMDVREAARIDGANGYQTLVKIIMPLLLVAVGPLLIASFAFNFNNFGLIFLLTGGGPFEADNTSIGSTDLLITYAFRLAFSGSAPNFGLAAAVSIIIFFIVALMSYSGFRRTKQLEEIN